MINLGEKDPGKTCRHYEHSLSLEPKDKDLLVFLVALSEVCDEEVNRAVKAFARLA